MNSIIAPTPTQYQYSLFKNPWDFRTSTPRRTVEFGPTYYKQEFKQIHMIVSQIKKSKTFKMISFKKTYMSPFSPKKLVN